MRLITFTVCIFFCALSAGVCQAVKIKPDPIVQGKIDKIALQLINARTQVEIDDSLAALRQFEQAQKDKTALMQQVICYFRYGANTEDRGYGAMILFNKLDVDKTARVKAALSCLDIQDAELRKIAVDILGTVDAPNGEKPDYSVYEELLRGSATNPPQALVRYMYQKAPDVALSTLAKVYLDKGQAKALVDQAKGQDEAKALDLLSKRSEWWTELYVAEKMKKNPKLRDPKLIERLKKSKHAVVRETVRKIEDEKK